MTTAKRTALLLVFSLSPAVFCLAGEIRPAAQQDSSAALAFTKPPLRAWWEKLSEPDRNAFLAKQPTLALSFEFHRTVLGSGTPAGVVAERSLKDWWDGLSRPQRDVLLAQHPGMRDAFRDWRKALDNWTAKERAPKSKSR